MTVKELKEMLEELDGDMQVEFADTYWRSEGWGEGCSSSTCSIDYVDVREGKVVLEGE